MAIATRRNPPTPAGSPLWGNWQQYTRNSLEFLQNSAHQYGDVFRLHFAYLYSYMFMHPDVSHEILARQAQAFEKDPIVLTLTEQKVILTLLARQCELILAADQKVEMEPLITIRPKGGMRMIISKR